MSAPPAPCLYHAASLAATACSPHSGGGTRFWERFHLEMSNEEAYAHMQALIAQSQSALVPQVMPQATVHCGKSVHAASAPVRERTQRRGRVRLYARAWALAARCRASPSSAISPSCTWPHGPLRRWWSGPTSSSRTTGPHDGVHPASARPKRVCMGVREREE